MAGIANTSAHSYLLIIKFYQISKPDLFESKNQTKGGILLYSSSEMTLPSLS